MKRRLLIISNSGAARECYWLVRDCIAAGEDMEFGGFLSFEGYQGELHELADYSLGAQFLNLIHPLARLIGSVSPGQANILACGSYVSCDTTIGDANYLNGSVVIGHDATIGDYNFFAPCTSILGGAAVGSENTFGVHSVLFEHGSIGNNNTIVPVSYVCKGCGNAKVMMGNPALVMGDVEELPR